MPLLVVSRRIWLPSIYGRLSFLLFSLSLLVLYFYGVGNAQRLTDATLIFLLRVESWVLILSFLSAVFSLLSNIITLPFQKKFRLSRILFSALGAVFSILLYLLVTLLQAFMTGYGV